MSQQPSASATDYIVVCRNSSDIITAEEQLTQGQLLIIFALADFSSPLAGLQASRIAALPHPTPICFQHRSQSDSLKKSSHIKTSGDPSFQSMLSQEDLKELPPTTSLTSFSFPLHP